MELSESYRLLIADVYELAGLSRRTSEGLAARSGQSVARWHVLSVLSTAPSTVPFIARRLGQARQSVQRVVDLLAADGLVDVRANPDHSRSPLCALTREGSRVLHQIVRRSDTARRQVLSQCDISAGELAQAQGVLRRVIDALSIDALSTDPGIGPAKAADEFPAGGPATAPTHSSFSEDTIRRRDSDDISVTAE